ncbi:hypothetical protein K439DRAFT_1642180 [Ramaria rubella]|nr:hypothetical protein K439DRAFT_1642180 [Ramaria rubella]
MPFRTPRSPHAPQSAHPAPAPDSTHSKTPEPIKFHLTRKTPTRKPHQNLRQPPSHPNPTPSPDRDRSCWC